MTKSLTYLFQERCSYVMFRPGQMGMTPQVELCTYFMGATGMDI